MSIKFQENQKNQKSQKNQRKEKKKNRPPTNILPETAQKIVFFEGNGTRNRAQRKRKKDKTLNTKGRTPPFTGVLLVLERLVECRIVSEWLLFLLLFLFVSKFRGGNSASGTMRSVLVSDS